MYYPGNYVQDWKEPRRSQSVESVFLPSFELGTAIKQVDGAETMHMTIIMMVVVPYGLREPPELGTTVKQVDGAETMPMTIIMMVVVPYGLREPPELLSADTHNHDEPLGE